MAALGQPVLPSDLSYLPVHQQPYQTLYQDLYPGQQQSAAAPAYAPSYPDPAGGMYAEADNLDGALQWEMPQVCCHFLELA